MPGNLLEPKIPLSLSKMK